MKLPKAIRGQIKKIILFLVVFISIFFFTNATEYGFAQEDSSSVEQILINVLPRQTDLKQGIKWVKSGDVYSSMQQKIGDAGVMWHGKTGRETFGDEWTCRVRASCSWFDSDYAMGYEFRKSPEGFQSNMINLYPDLGQVYPDLPGGVIFHHNNLSYFQSYEIFFWKSPEYTGRIMVEGPPDIIDSRAEVEQLAKLMYSRLPDSEITLTPELNPDENSATGILPAGNNPGQNGSNTPGSTPGSSLSGADLSAGALFTAVGLTALVTLFGSVGVALTNGMSLQGAWSELTAFIGSVIPGKVVESPLEAEQTIYPEETFVETPLPEEPLSPMSTGQPTPPTLPQEEVEDFWNKAEKEITEQIEAEEETKPKLKARTYKTSEEILTEITGPLEELVSQMENDGVQVINLKNSHLIDLMTRTTIDISDQTKWVRCGDLVDQKIGLIRSLAKEKFGAGAIVDQVAIGEASSLEASSDPVDWIRNRLPYNHTAIRIIAPDGQAYIIDFWQALQGSPLIQTEERWVANWVKEFNPNDLTFQAWRGWSAEEQSAANQIRRIGIEGYRRSMEKKINAPGLEKQAKQVKLKELNSFINYYRLRGGRFGYNFGSGYSTRF
jgi:hypothetical protein